MAVHFYDIFMLIIGSDKGKNLKNRKWRPEYWYSMYFDARH